MTRLRWGMVGGGPGAFIGAVHRRATGLTEQYELVAGAFSGDAERSRAFGQTLGIAADRSYGSWEAMLEGELALPEHLRIQGVSIVTPNHMHYPVARAFAQASIPVVCDKPLVHTSEQAADLLRIVAGTGSLFAVTYNYTGYPMVRQARDLVRGGVLGEVRKVQVLYNQGWLSTRLEGQGNPQADWRTDPRRSGIAGAMGDIGSHAENLIATVTGLTLEAVCADLTTFVPGRALDDDASLLLRFQGGARGLLAVSQIACGLENDLSLQVFGTRGSLRWQQETPNHLDVFPLEGPQQRWTRGNSALSPSAQAASHVPSGHPEGFTEAFANLYRGVAETLLAQQEGRTPDPQIAQFPTLEDGARGVHFIEKTVESASSTQKWTHARWEGN
ncbi:Gfo/Idh/MocA family protein [Deinococcus oregonensis]|uniref:Gfo/Idh/MocA family protein n=1 Tax=Deinococcus oregonensis TaxID=1805970 RepID=A0ABV6B2H1_9DEIO